MARLVEATASSAAVMRPGTNAVRSDASTSMDMEALDLFGSQIQGDIIGVAQWRIYQGAASAF